jgi:hypothetical protein
MNVRPLVPDDDDDLPFAQAGRPEGYAIRRLYARWAVEHLTAVDPSTYRRHARVRDLLDDAGALGDHPSPVEVKTWLRHLSEMVTAKGAPRYRVGGRTLVDFRGAISQWYEWGAAMNMVRGNPAYVGLPLWKKSEQALRRAERHRSPVRVDDANLDATLARLGPMERACALFCRVLGVRPSEARGVYAWGPDNDFGRDAAGMTVRIARQRRMDLPESPWGLQPLKGGEKPNTLPVPAMLEAVLAPLIAAGRPQVRTGRGGGGRMRVDFLFPLHTSNQTTDLNKAMQASGHLVPGQGLYVMRHSFAGALGDAKVDMREAQKALRHVWISSTQGYYDRSGVSANPTANAMANAIPKNWPAHGAAPPRANGPTPALPGVSAGPEKQQEQDDVQSRAVATPNAPSTEDRT